MTSEPFQMVIDLPPGPESPAFLKVCGSTVLTRLVILAKRAGAGEVAVIGDEAQTARARSILESDPRVTSVRLLFAIELPPLRAGALRALANVVVSLEAVKALAASPGGSFVPGAVNFTKVGVPPRPLWTDTAPEGAYVVPMEDPRMSASATVALARSVVLSHARSAGSSPVAKHLHERFSQPLSRLLVEMPVTPNHVTLLNTVLGLLAAWLWSQGSFETLAIGGLLMQVTSVLDCVDGELARGKLLESKWGAWFDTVGDHVVNFAWVVGLAVGYAQYLWSVADPVERRIGPLMGSIVSGAVIVLALTLVAGLFLSLLVKRSGTKLKDVAASFRASDRQQSPLFRWLDKFYVLGRRASIALVFTVLGILPALTGRRVFYDALFLITGGFLLLANLYVVLGVIKTGLSRR